jgi:hypothetical protein
MLALELLELLLDRAVLGQRSGLSCLPAQGLDLLLGVGQRLFGGEHHIVGPALQLLPRLLKIAVVLLQRTTEGGLGTALALRGRLWQGCTIAAMEREAV